jgi:hypothetical protein
MYNKVLNYAQKAAHSNLSEAKTVALGTLQRLLIEKPEQEQTILSLLVDKMVNRKQRKARRARRY